MQWMQQLKGYLKTMEIKNNCKQCQNIFIPRRNGGKPQKFCSALCRFAEWRTRNSEKTKVTVRKWAQKNPNYQKVWRLKNHDKIKTHNREWRANWRKNNPGLNTLISATWRKNHPNEAREYQEEYNKNNRKRINDNWNKMYARRHQTDANFKIAKNLRNRMRKIFKGINKSSSSLELLGVKSVSEIKRHIEQQFKPGMTWENYNFYTWHIDHICPLFSFNLIDIQQQRKAFHYTNLQPLWTKENLKKGKRLLISNP